MKVSVVLPLYNRTHLLRGSLASILAQTRPADEIVVVDDCSPEDTSWLESEFPMVRVVRLDKNGGPPRARYHGALAATGTHIATLDSDDFWYPEKLEKQIAFVEKTNDPGGVYSHLQWVEEGDLGGVRPAFGPRPGEPLCDYLHVRNGFLQSNTLFMERELYLETCRLAEDKFLEDAEMVIVAGARNHRVYLQEEILSHWNCTNDPGRISNNKWEQRVQHHLEIVKDFLTPKARAAYAARNMGPVLVQKGKVVEAAKLIGNAIRLGAFSPSGAAKVTLNTFCPAFYRWIQTRHSRMRAVPPNLPREAAAASVQQ